MTQLSFKTIPLLAALVAGGAGVAPAQTEAAEYLRQIKTVFVVALENHNWIQPVPDSNPQQIFRNPAAPYINSLVTAGNPNAAQVSYATRYYNAGQQVHPSEPNYVWSEAGTTFGVYTDNDPGKPACNLFTCQHLSGQLTTAGVSWRDYQEDVQYSPSELVSASGSGVPVNPYNGTTEYDYAVKHNPMAFFTDTQNQNCQPLTNFWTDLADNRVGRYNWITPDQLNEMHSSLPAGFNYDGTAWTGDQAAIAEGDHCLSLLIPKIMASKAYQDHGVIIIWTDETEDGDDTNHTLPEIIISPLAKGNAYASSVVYSHASDLKTMDEIFGLAFQTNAIPFWDVNAFGRGYNQVATANDLSDMFRAPEGRPGAPAESAPPSHP